MGSAKAEATKTRILDAALTEFAAHGLAGARVERIAAASGFNKNLIYVYFENKESLFNTVIQRNSEQIAERLPFTPDDLPGYAARAFDYAMAHPEAMRLVGWFGLENRADEPKARTAYMAEQSQRIAQGQTDGKISGAFTPGFLMTTVLALASAWSASSPWGPSMAPQELDEPDALRGSIARVIALLTTDQEAAVPSGARPAEAVGTQPGAGRP
ncbi:TetR/AcrR family transcriptional regulator [Streptacidiphilus sp. EB129]|jgi:AcrR family transcriptional regulator|uniref:TetR/AcrR family transcriptional regulator n=1 Tax=Streptacidiphilus sp. EB129 TaxID=3156262 RepID=UPI003512C9FF